MAAVSIIVTVGNSPVSRRFSNTPPLNMGAQNGRIQRYSVPPEVYSSHFVEESVVRSVESAQPAKRLNVDWRMAATFAGAEAKRRLGTGTCRRTQAREPLRGVEVEVAAVDQRPQAEEALYGGHFSGGIGDEPLPADEE